LGNLPIDVFYEVASYLHPKDLLSLFRTCKYARAEMASADFLRVWVMARERLQIPPPSPPHTGEIQYASFLFETICGV
ncbi:hypothetical protein K474DRAFT_1572899, partial [Panus rudis PR-1116 ss-1]